MKWEWATDTFKGLIVVAGGWVANYSRKKAIPFLKAIIKHTKVVNRVDVLERKQAITKSRQLALFRTDPNPLFVMNTEGELIFANPAWGEMTGFSNIADAYGKGYLKAVHEDDREEIEKHNERLVQHPSSFEGEVRFRHIKNKNIIITMCRSELVYDHEKQLVEIIGRLFII